MAVVRQVPLRFAVPGSPVPAPADLSTVCRDRSWLWLAGDESPSVDRLTLAPDGASYEDRRTFALGELVDLPEGPGKEVDVEGLDRDGPYLWLVGSHSRTRKRGDPEDDDDTVRRDLARVRSHPNRRVLLRLPLADDGDDPHPVRSVDTPDGPTLTAALLDGDLTQALAADEHLAPFLTVPGKDNGLDVEGLAAVDGALLLGLRGPVLRGWAVLLEVRVRPHPDRPDRLVLDGGDGSDGGGGAGYRTFLLDLDGLGIRDLCRVGPDVVVLAGPTMDLDGPVRLHRWPGAVHARERDVLRGRQLPRVEELPYGTGPDEGRDHPEGLTSLPGGDSDELLVVHDSPAESRLVDPATVLADVVRLGAPGPGSSPDPGVQPGRLRVPAPRGRP